MTKDYEGKIGIKQLLLCLIAAATLFIPYALEPSIVFSVDKIMPIGSGPIAGIQTEFISALLETVGISASIPDAVYDIIPYTLYAFYGIIAFNILFTLLMMFIRNEVMRQILRALSIFLGFIMIFIFVINLLSVAGFFTYYLNGGFGEEALIFDCIKNEGFLYFVGVLALSAIVMVKQFSSFFGKSY